MNAVRIKQIWPWVEFVILFSFLTIFYYSRLETITFQPDESQWIGTSYVFEDFFCGDFDSPSWDESYWTITQPPLPRYVIGLGRMIGGLGVADLNTPWDWNIDPQINLSRGGMPSKQLLWWSRFPMGILAACAMLIGFFSLKKLQGRFTGYLWIFLCSLSSFFPEMLNRAMGEAPLLASVAGILLVSDRLLQSSFRQKPIEKREKLYLSILFLGIMIGFAQSSKLNGLSAIGAGFAIVLIIMFRMDQSRTLRIRFGLISVLNLIFSSQLTFLSLNPYLWKKPLIRTGILFVNRVNEMRIQQKVYPEYKIEGLTEHIRVVVGRIFQSYSTIHFDDALWFNVIFFVIGLAYMMWHAFQYLEGTNLNSAAVSILLVGGATSIPSLFTPLDWDRYYLLPIYFSTLTIAVVIWWSGLLVYRSIGKQINLRRNTRIA